MDQFQFNEQIETPIYTYYPPLAPVRGFISIPHSGLIIPDEFGPYLIPELSQHDLNCDVDYAVDKLINIQQLQQAGACILVAKVHRVCIDLNRAPNCAVFGWKDNTHGVKLVQKEPEEEQIKSFLEVYHTPYFDFMTRVVTNIQSIKLGFVSLLDLHSMPSKPTAYHLKKNPNQDLTIRRKDFCLSNLNGLSCQRSYINGFKDQLYNNGDYTAAINDPYFGGYVTQFMDEHYKGNVIQCEINRDIYMDEKTQLLIDDKVKELIPVLTKTITEVFIAFNTPFVKDQEVEVEGAEKDEVDAQFAFAF